MKKIASILGTSILSVGLLTACGEAEVSKVEDNKAEQASKEKEEVKQEYYKVGDTVSIDGMEITLLSAKYVSPAEYSPSEKGKIIEIEVSAKNNKDDNGYVDNTEFSISDEEGNMLDPYYGHDYSFTGEVKAGKKLTGKVYFDVTESNEYELFYEPSFTLKSNAEVKFLIEKSELE